MADASNSGSSSSPDVADNLPGPSKGKLAETTRQQQQQADQQEALANGAGFQFDPDELRHPRDEWQDLARELNDLRRRTRNLGSAYPRQRTMPA